MKKCSNDELNNLIKIQFVEEPAVEQGGPRKEFFSLVHSQVSNSGMFIGKENRKCFNHDILALQQRSFYIYGQLCYIAVMQGSPCFFAPSVEDHIVYGKIEKVETCIEDVLNQKVKQRLEELAKIEDPQVFSESASFECCFRFNAGFSKPLITFQEKDKLFHAIALHYTLSSCSGLNVHGLLDLLRKHPQQARRLFLYTENQLNAELVNNLFVPLFSPAGSNKCATEELVSLNFTRYLEDVESGGVTTKIVDLNKYQ